MHRPKGEVTLEMLKVLAALPEEEGWAIARKLETAPGCSLLGDLAVTPHDVEKLVQLRSTLDNTTLWLAQIAVTPACPLENGDTDYAQFI